MEGNSREVYPGEIYRHFKGNLYQIITVAIHSETGEKLVIYQKLYGDFLVHARPYDMFISQVDHEKYKEVKQKYRFELVSDIYGRNSITNDKLDLDTSSSNNITKSNGISNLENNHSQLANPHLMEFLDADTYEQKRSILASIRNSLTDRLIDDIAASMDVTVDEGDLDTRYRSLMNCIDMRVKFEINRFR